MFYSLMLVAPIPVCLYFAWTCFLSRRTYPLILAPFAAEYGKRIRAHKKRLFAEFHSLNENQGHTPFVVLEIGCGTGANFEFYPPGSEIICVDANPHMTKYLLESAKRWPGVRIKSHHVAEAENLRHVVSSESVDAVVCTLTLCSVRSVDACLAEIIRVLKPVSTQH